MTSDYPFTTKIVSPVKCSEKPWDLWVSEIGHSSPKQDDFSGVFSPSTGAEAKASPMRRLQESHPYKVERNHVRYKRSGFTRLKYETAKLHGFFPQMDNLNVAVCHMCGVVVKCSAVYKHLLETHSVLEPILPPPPPAPSIKLKSSHSKSRHKKDNVDLASVKVQKPQVSTNNPPLSRLVLPDMQYIEEPSTSMTGELQVCVESGELPVVSIQDTEELPLGENITDDIFAIMNSEGIQSADDITNVADWKNIIRDIGSMQDINFAQPVEGATTQEIYQQDPSYTVTEADLSRVQLTTHPSAVQRTDSSLQKQALKPINSSAISSTTKHHSRSKSSKSKSGSVREYDPNKHCGVVTPENPKPCTRSLTCKAHTLSSRRMVEGRSKKFDLLLAEHRASKDASTNPPTLPNTNSATITIPPTLDNTQIDINNFNNMTAEQQVNDIYASLLSVEDPNAVLPDTTTLTSLLSQPLTADSFLLPDDAEIPAEIPIISIASPEVLERLESKIDEEPPPSVPPDVCWYTSCPRPLAICTFNTSHSGGAITLGKKFATVRSNIKSSLTRTQCKNTNPNNFYYQSALSKTLQVNKNKLEVRKLIVTGSNIDRRVHQTLSDMFSSDIRHTVNGHLQERRPRSGSIKQTKGQSQTVLDLGFSLDPILADEKC